MTTPYWLQMNIANRWDKTVDWASPKSAWSDAMLATPPSERTFEKLVLIRKQQTT